MLIAATIAVGFNIPIVHLFGGAVTFGSTDENHRHAISKMSNIHLVAHQRLCKKIAPTRRGKLENKNNWNARTKLFKKKFLIIQINC